MINERCTEILYRLINTQKPIKLNSLSKIFKLSTRTIRYDLDKIDDFLLFNGLTPLERDSNLGVSYRVSNEHIKKLMTLMNNKLSEEYVINSDERINYILISLFRLNDYIVIDILADNLKVSRSTLINDLKKVKKWLKERKLKLEAVPSKGIRVTGNEKDYRSAILYLLLQSLNFNFSADSMNKSETVNKKILDSKFNKLFENLDIDIIKRTVESAEKQLNKYFSDESYSALVLHIALAIKRIQLGKGIHISSNELDVLKIYNEFSVASTMAKILEDKFKIKVPIDEIGYITLHLLSGKENNKKVEIRNDENWIQIQTMSRKIMENIEAVVGVDFIDDDILYDGLLKHLGPTIYRLKNNLPLYNPMLNEIKKEYSVMFENVKNSVEPLENLIGRKIPDEELGYLTIHFEASYERKKNAHKNIYRVILVCSTGIGTSKLLESRLNCEFNNLKITDTISSHQIQFTNLQDIDFIISTIQLEHLDKPVLNINPMLSDKDIDKINKFCKENLPVKASENCKPVSLLNEIMSIVENNCSITSKVKLINELSNCLVKAGLVDSKEVYQPMLSELLTKDTIRVNVEAADWKDAVRKGGEVLVENGIVEPRFIEAMIKMVKEMGPYIVFVPGIAMPHARPNEGVIKLGMSLIKLSTPVNFGNKEYDPVNIVICLGAIDNYSHAKALSSLVDLLNDKERIKVLRNANTVEEVLEVIKDKN